MTRSTEKILEAEFLTQSDVALRLAEESSRLDAEHEEWEFHRNKLREEEYLKNKAYEMFTRGKYNRSADELEEEGIEQLERERQDV